MANHFYLLFLAGMSLIFIGGCASHPVARLEPSQGESNKTLLLMNYDLITSEDLAWRDSCVLNLTQLETQTHYQVKLFMGNSLFQVEAPAGEYRVENIECGSSSRKWELNNFGAAKVFLTDKKINYLGRFTFKLSTSERINNLKIERGNRDQTIKILRETSTLRADDWNNRLVSAYNGQSIPVSYVSNAKSYARGSTSRVTGNRVKLNQIIFDSCEKNEFITNPVPVGILSYVVIYEKDQWVESKLIQSKNSFSEAYVHCIESGLKEFKPGFSGHVEYRINL